MSLIAIFSLLLLQKTMPDFHVSHPDAWYDQFIDWLGKKSLGNNAILLISVIVPAVLVGWLLIIIDLALVTLAVDIVILFWASGTGGWRKAVDQFIASAEAEKLAPAKQLAIDKFEIKSMPATTSLSDVCHAVNNHLSLVTFSRFFNIIFWYALLGSAGVVLVRLTDNAMRHELSGSASDAEVDRQPKVVQTVRSIQYGLNWPSVRLHGLVLSLVGNFEHTFKLFLSDMSTEQKDEQQQLIDYVCQALNLKTLGGTTRVLKSQMLLIERARLIWLAGLSVVFVLLG